MTKSKINLRTCNGQEGMVENTKFQENMYNLHPSLIILKIFIKGLFYTLFTTKQTGMCEVFNDVILKEKKL